VEAVVKHNLDCLILAAGSGSRFGACKLVAPWQGEPILARVVNAAREVRPQSILVVTGAWHRELVATVAPRCPAATFVHCPTWAGGMGHSLAFGAAQLPAQRPLMVLLGDTPGLCGTDLRSLWHLWQKDPAQIACAAFAGTRGVPAIFPAATKPALQKLTGERGAKHLLTSEANSQTQALAMPMAALDIDTPQDLVCLEEDYSDYAHP
jgi:molybdenum cofactor cytidylyltransferase